MGVHTIAGKEVAIKIEPALARNSPLKQESKIYKTLMGGPGVPWIMWSGKQGDFNVMVIDLLGPSLEDLFKMCNRHFTLKTVLLLTDQLVSVYMYWRRGCRTPRQHCSTGRENRRALHSVSQPHIATVTDATFSSVITDRIHPHA